MPPLPPQPLLALLSQAREIIGFLRINLVALDRSDEDGFSLERRTRKSFRHDVLRSGEHGDRDG